jgi:transglutaminase/protease-like cytokinesis protein 3
MDSNTSQTSADGGHTNITNNLFELVEKLGTDELQKKDEELEQKNREYMVINKYSTRISRKLFLDKYNIFGCNFLILII